MNTRVTITTIFFFLSLSLMSQEMEKGYQYLETNQFQNAKQFFNETLKEYPGNKTARICLARAMGLSTEPLAALDLFQKLETEFPDDYEVGLNLAEAHMWNKQFPLALAKYKLLLKQDPNNFTAHLGYANALAGLQQNKQALQMINTALQLEPGNAGATNSKKYILIAIAYGYAKKRDYSDAEQYLDSVDIIEVNQPNAIQIRQLIADQKALKGSISYYQSSDNAENIASGIAISQSKAWHAKNILSVSAHLRSTDNLINPAVAHQNNYFLSNKTILSEAISLECGIGLNENKTAAANTKNIVSITKVAMQLDKRNFLSVGHRSSYLNYNSQLVSNNLRSDILHADYHVYSAYKLGFYNSFNFGHLSDGNKSIVNFSSLYYQWAENPILKIGVNYSYIHYSNAHPELYFSPDKYQVGEGFLHSENSNSSSRWKYKVLVAAGIQQVENNTYQTIKRMELLAGYRFTKELTLNVNYLYSNAAQINAVGTYEFQKMGLSLNTVF